MAYQVIQTEKANFPISMMCRCMDVSPSGYSKRRSLKLNDLDTESIVVAPDRSPNRVMLSQALATAGATWSVAVEATGWELMIQFARDGLGVAVVNDSCRVPRGLVGVRLEGVPDVEYHVVTGPGAELDSRDTLARMILETAA